MVAKACRCATCRARKVRCDQQWPECGQCKRGKRKCPGPPANIKFVSNKTLASCFEASRPPANDLTDASVLASLRVAPRVPYPVNHAPACSVAAALVYSLQASEARYNPTWLGTFVKHLPAMLDSSPALTAVVACCLDACKKNTLLRRDILEHLDPSLYGRALVGVHAALADPTRNRLDSTFYAVVLLQRVETVLVNRKLGMVPCWSVHAGGLSELLQFRGVTDPGDDVAFETVLENFGPVASHSFTRNEDCLFASPEWQSAFRRERPQSTLTQRLLLAVYSQTAAFLPRLLVLTRAWRQGEDCLDKAMNLAMKISETLRAVGQEIETSILPALEVRTLQSAAEGSPVQEVYVDVPRQIARVMCWHACISISANRFLAELSRDCEVEHDRMPATLEDQNLELSRRLWMLSEEARIAGLMRYYFYPGPLAVSIDSAASEETRQWIVDLMNEVQLGRVADTLWTQATIQGACDALCGRLCPLQINGRG